MKFGIAYFAIPVSPLDFFSNFADYMMTTKSSPF